MNTINDIIKTKKFKQFKFSDRQTLENSLKGLMVKSKKKEKTEVVKLMAKALNKSIRSINREISQGTVMIQTSLLDEIPYYSAVASQRVADSKKGNNGIDIKLGKDKKLATHIEKKIKEENYSPAAVLGEIKVLNLEFDVSISVNTLYKYIDKGYLMLTNEDLPQQGIRKKKKKSEKPRKSYKNEGGTSIEERPVEASSREYYGHWEIDCVVGKRNKGAVLLVLTERATREEIIRKMKSKTQECVVEELNKLEKKFGKRFKKIFKTITADNGTEFLNHKGMEASILIKEEKRTKIYYAHPYSSYERGSNENANKLIRRFIPKGTSIDNFTKKQIQAIEDWMNNYPRKIFNFKTANDLKKQLKLAG